MKRPPKKGAGSRGHEDASEHDPDDAAYAAEDAADLSRNGEFFLGRYRRIDPSVVPSRPADLRQALRVSTARTDARALMRSLNARGAMLKPISWLRNGYFVSASFSLGATTEYLLGHYYLQGPLSQLACEVLDPAPGSRVLDMAAAPGGKATYLATMVGEKGVVVALDSDASRLSAVRNNAERLGLANMVCIRKDARFAADLKEKFSSIILDAPCSGNFCSEDGWFSKRSLDDIKRNARTQRELIRAAHACLAPGGRLLYSTCSLEPEEDELIIDWALQKMPDLDVVDLSSLPIGDPGVVSWEDVALDPRLSRVRRFWPHKTGCEGFFIALLEKKA